MVHGLMSFSTHNSSLEGAQKLSFVPGPLCYMYVLLLRCSISFCQYSQVKMFHFNGHTEDDENRQFMV